jgi:germ cell nuclear acidic protein
MPCFILLFFLCTDRLRRTLSHEMCHAAAWIIDHVRKPPHGRVFKRWARKVQQVYPNIPVSTCHDYEIFFKFRYRCTNENCGHEYGRHSDSINPAKHGCGKCGSYLVSLGKFNRDGTPASTRKTSAYALYVKHNYDRVKCQNPHSTSTEIMKLVAQEYRLAKSAKSARI